MGLSGKDRSVRADTSLLDHSFPRELQHEDDEYSDAEIYAHRHKMRSLISEYNDLIALVDPMDVSEWTFKVRRMTDKITECIFNVDYTACVISFDISAAVRSRVSKIQFVLVTDFQTSFDKVMEDFDISICRVGMIFSENGDPSFLMSDDTEDDIRNMGFRISKKRGLHDPKNRIQKYIKRGFAKIE
jgi:hypothetical protein